MSSEKNPTRERILKAAWSLLESGEGGAVRMSDIAKASKISRQALYLHFPNRADLLIATTRYLDEVHDIDGRLTKSRKAGSGSARLRAWVEAWSEYIPVIYGVAKALMAMKDDDPEALAAWNDRMSAVREGCSAVVADLKAEGALVGHLSEEEAADLLFALLSVRTWEELRIERGWTQARYVNLMQETARRTFLKLNS
ncbi:MAG: TetR/AcrR family transcriptional regulator [Rhodobacteraceae bacterium]|nr:TetR/AcrR family transcriptional regulator [Paracoccaceae bacterium]